MACIAGVASQRLQQRPAVLAAWMRACNRLSFHVNLITYKRQPTNHEHSKKHVVQGPTCDCATDIVGACPHEVEQGRIEVGPHVLRAPRIGRRLDDAMHNIRRLVQGKRAVLLLDLTADKTQCECCDIPLDNRCMHNTWRVVQSIQPQRSNYQSNRWSCLCSHVLRALPEAAGEEEDGAGEVLARCLVIQPREQL